MTRTTSLSAPRPTQPRQPPQPPPLSGPLAASLADTSTFTLNKQAELFAAVSAPRLRALAERGMVRRYRRDTVLMEEGDAGSVLLVVLSGRVRAYSTALALQGNRAFLEHSTERNDEANASGTRREITYGVYGPGDLVGEMSLDGGPRSASVITLSATTCSVIHRSVVHAFVADEPEFAFDLLSRVIAKTRHATQSARNLALTDAYGRLSELLTTQAITQDDGSVMVEERMTQQDIAQRIGCSREMVSRLLKDLESGGYLSMHERRYVLLRRLPGRW